MLSYFPNMLRLSSPALPIGSYSYSDGLEWAVEINCVNSEESLKNWINEILRNNYKNFELPFLRFIYAHFISNDSNNIIFLNTSGELYSINYVTQRINWVLNFKNLSQQNEANLFLSQPVVIKDETVIVSTDKSLLSYNVISGARNWNKIVAPILISRGISRIVIEELLISL